MQNFRFSIPTEILFGQNQIVRLPNEIIKNVKNVKPKVLLVYGSKSIKENKIYEQVVNLFNENDIAFQELKNVQPNPKVESVEEGVSICKKYNINFVLAVGAGSVIDCAKIIAAGAFYNGNPWDFLTRKALIEKALPIGTVLTLAATGSDMNGNAVISNPNTRQKKSVYHYSLRPKFSILDPTYTYTVSQYQTAAGTVDIMSHVMEQYFSPIKGTFIQDRMAEAVLKTCIHYVRIALKNPADYEARANLLWTNSLALSGLLSFGKRGDWVCHAIEHEISAHNDMTHGAGLAIVTPLWLNHVLDNSNLDKFASFAENVWKISAQKDKTLLARKGINALSDFFKEIGMPSRLRDVDITKEDLPKMAKNIIKSHSENQIGFFKKLNEKDILNILISSF